MKLKPLILPAISCVLWGLLAWSGFDGEVGVEQRMGRVSLGQVQFYVVFPLVMLSLSVIPAVLLSQTRWSFVGGFWSGVSMLMVLPYLYYYGGGV